MTSLNNWFVVFGSAANFNEYGVYVHQIGDIVPRLVGEVDNELILTDNVVSVENGIATTENGNEYTLQNVDSVYATQYLGAEERFLNNEF